MYRCLAAAASLLTVMAISSGCRPRQTDNTALKGEVPATLQVEEPLLIKLKEDTQTARSRVDALRDAREEIGDSDSPQEVRAARQKFSAVIVAIEVDLRTVVESMVARLTQPAALEGIQRSATVARTDYDKLLGDFQGLLSPGGGLDGLRDAASDYAIEAAANGNQASITRNDLKAKIATLTAQLDQAITQLSGWLASITVSGVVMSDEICTPCYSVRGREPWGNMMVLQAFTGFTTYKAGRPTNSTFFRGNSSDVQATCDAQRQKISSCTAAGGHQLSQFKQSKFEGYDLLLLADAKAIDHHSGDLIRGGCEAIKDSPRTWIPLSTELFNTAHGNPSRMKALAAAIDSLVQDKEFLMLYPSSRDSDGNRFRVKAGTLEDADNGDNKAVYHLRHPIICQSKALSSNP